VEDIRSIREILPGLPSSITTIAPGLDGISTNFTASTHKLGSMSLAEVVLGFPTFPLGALSKVFIEYLTPSALSTSAEPGASWSASGPQDPTTSIATGPLSEEYSQNHPISGSADIRHPRELQLDVVAQAGLYSQRGRIVQGARSIAGAAPDGQLMRLAPSITLHKAFMTWTNTRRRNLCFKVSSCQVFRLLGGNPGSFWGIEGYLGC
jgi:hypothetical protein